MKKIEIMLLLILPIFLFSSVSIFDIQRANVWVEDGSNSKTFYINEWSKDANLDGSTILSNSTPVSSASSSRTLQVLVNDVPTSYPRLKPSIPKLSLVGFNPPSATLGVALGKPTISISPDGGDFNETVAVTFTYSAPATTSDTVHYSIDDINKTESVTSGKKNNFTIYLVKKGRHKIMYELESEGVKRTVYFTLRNSDFRRDSDGDGLPDSVEAELGLNPFANTIPDSDGNGWNDFDEYMRDYNLADSDGDGWSDWDETVLRETDPNNPTACADTATRPTATSLYGVEYTLSTPATKSGDLEPIPQIQRASLVDIRSQKRYDSLLLSQGGDTLVDGDNATLRLCDTTESIYKKSLINGNVPTMRAPADIPLIARVRYFKKLENDSSIIHKTWVPSRSAITLQEYLASEEFATLPEDFTASKFTDGYIEYLKAHLMVNRSLELSEEESINVSLIEAAMATRIESSDDNDSTRLLGHPDFAPSINLYNNTMHAVSQKSGRSANNLFRDLVKLAKNSAVKEKAADQLKSCDSNETKELCLAKFIQHKYSPTFTYQLSLITIVPFADAESNNTVYNPSDDTDKDGIKNSDEVLPVKFTNPLNPDNDNDGVVDSKDACPTDSEDMCINDLVTQTDTDGDGVYDSVDNCPFVPNADQESTLVDGVGDACAKKGIVMISPRTNISIYQGDSVNFEAIKTLPTSKKAIWLLKNTIVQRGGTTYSKVFTDKGEFEVCTVLEGDGKDKASCIKVNVLEKEIEASEITAYANDIIEGNSGEKNLLVEVVLNNPATKDISYEYSTYKGTFTAEEGSDYRKTEGTLTFKAGESRNFIRIPIIGDTDVEEDETFGLRIGDDYTIALNIINDDSVEIDPVLSIELLHIDDNNSNGIDEVLEGNADHEVTFRLRLNKPAPKEGTIHYETIIPTGDTSMVHEVSGDIVFAVGEQEKDINVVVIGDTIEELDKVFSIKLTAAVNITMVDDSNNRVDVKEIPLVIIDDDHVSSTPYMLISMSDGVSGNELWITNGDTNGTHMLADLVEGESDSNPENFLSLGITTYFSAVDADFNPILYRSNGTQDSTVALKSFAAEDTNIRLSNFMNIDGVLYFVVKSGEYESSATELWKATSSSVQKVTTLKVGGYDFETIDIVPIGSTLYFASSTEDATGTELYKYDTSSSEESPARVKDIATGDDNSSHPSNLIDINNTLYFTANMDQEIWKSDGTEAGTVAVIDATVSPGASYSKIHLINGNIYATATQDINGTYYAEIYKLEPGTESFNLLVAYANTNINTLVDLNGMPYYLLLPNSGNEESKLMRIEPDNVVEIASFENRPYALKTVGNNLYIQYNTMLQSYNGTDIQTIKTWESGTGLSIVSDSLNQELYFKLKNYNAKPSYDELWKTDGTTEGTVKLQPQDTPN